MIAAGSDTADASQVRCCTAVLYIGRCLALGIRQTLCR
jgi:hypothetical protein